MHWRLAAKWNELPFSEFIALEGSEQSRLVAAYETSMQIEAVQQMDIEKEARRKNRTGSPGKRRK